MKLQYALILGLVCSMVVQAQDCVVNLENNGTQCFKTIVENFGKIAQDPKSTDVENHVAEMISGVIDLIQVAKDNGLSISKEECNKMFNDLDDATRVALQKVFCDDDATRGQEIAPDDQNQADQEVSKGCGCKKCSCKNSNCTNANCCCKRTEEIKTAACGCPTDKATDAACASDCNKDVCTCG